MTSFARVWDASYEADPADTDQASGGAQDIRQVKTDVKERLAVDHSMAGDADDGAHKKVTLIEQASDPTNIANRGFFYAKDASGVTELFYIDSAGNVTQLTSAGVINVALNSNTMHQSSGLDVKTQGSIDGTDANGVQLDNDADSPGNLKLYGTSSSGVRGWRAGFSRFTHDFGQATFATFYSAAHGLGATPDLLYWWLQCTSAVLGYSVGDRIMVETDLHTAGADATNVFVTFGGTSNTIRAMSKSATGEASALTLGSGQWKLLVVAIRFG